MGMSVGVGVSVSGMCGCGSEFMAGVPAAVVSWLLELYVLAPNIYGHIRGVIDLCSWQCHST